MLEPGQIWKEAALRVSKCVCFFVYWGDRMNKYMDIAIKEAEKAYKKGEVPVGAIIVKDGKVIAKAHNTKETKRCAVNHAEILCIIKASKKLKTWHLDNCEMYVTLEPCMMCTGSIILSRIHAIYYGTNDPKGGCVNTLIDINQIKKINHQKVVMKV